MRQMSLFESGTYYIRLKTTKIDPQLLSKFYDLKYIKNNSFRGFFMWNVEETFFFSEYDTKDLIAIPMEWIEFAIPECGKSLKEKKEV